MTHHEAALRGLVEQWRLMADGAQRVTSKLALNHCANQVEALLTAPAPPALSPSPEEREEALEAAFWAGASLRPEVERDYMITARRLLGLPEKKGTVNG